MVSLGEDKDWGGEILRGQVSPGEQPRILKVRESRPAYRFYGAIEPEKVRAWKTLRGAYVAELQNRMFLPNTEISVEDQYALEVKAFGKRVKPLTPSHPLARTPGVGESRPRSSLAGL